MSLVKVLNIIPKNHISKFNSQYSFQIIMDITSELKKEIEWKMIYIFSDNKKDDQILSEIRINPTNQLGKKVIDFIGDAPIIEKIPQSDVLGAALILLCSSYNEQVFFRCGYFINVYYDNDEMNINIPEKIEVNHLVRDILADKPRIVIFEIKWEEENGEKEKKNDEDKNLISNEDKNNLENNISMEKEKNNNRNKLG